MLTKKLLIVLSVIVMAAAFVFIQGCDTNDNPVEATSTQVKDVDSLGAYPYTEFIGISADSINALARTVAGTDGKRTATQTAAGWQLYVSVPFYSQNDPSFKDEPLGFNSCHNSTIGQYGCHLCCVAMLYAKWGYYNVTPLFLNNWKVGSRSHYAFSTSSCGDLIRPAQALQYPAMSRNVRYISAGQIYSYVQRGIPVVIEVGAYGGSHFMIIFAFDGRVFWVKDPLRDAAHQNQGLYGSFKSARVYGYW